MYSPAADKPPIISPTRAATIVSMFDRFLNMKSLILSHAPGQRDVARRSLMYCSQAQPPSNVPSKAISSIRVANGPITGKMVGKLDEKIGRSAVLTQASVSDIPTTFGTAGFGIRLKTIIRLRWIAVAGQLIAVALVLFGLGFQLPVGYCLLVIALSAWLNIYLTIRYPARLRLSSSVATIHFAYDILQLMLLLYLTGGIENPFILLLVAPVTISAATLPLRNTIALGLIAMLASLTLVYNFWPLPWHDGIRFQLPYLYKQGVFASVCASLAFVAFYAWRLAQESRQMSTALAAAEQVLAREQKLHALDGLAAAAAHELGTPLSTIVLVTKELERDIGQQSTHREDLELLRSQADRCREILQKLTREPSEQDPMHARQSIRELLDEAVAPYRSSAKKFSIDARADESAEGNAAQEPVGTRQPGVMYGLTNIIENAADYARSSVDITARWNSRQISIVIMDDGPGFSQDVIDSLGEPYVTTRYANTGRRSSKVSGLGLGFFISKTLLERSGATLELENRNIPQQGAIVRISWRREAFTENRGKSSADHL